jgi:hypothetical protein
VSDGRVHTQFYPSGRIDRTLVHLARANDERDAMTVEINPVTGRVKVYAEYRDDVAAAVK